MALLLGLEVELDVPYMFLSCLSSLSQGKSKMHASAAHRPSPAEGGFYNTFKALQDEGADIRPPRIVEVA
jgi:hypothetical protein